MSKRGISSVTYIVVSVLFWGCIALGVLGLPLGLIAQVVADGDLTVQSEALARPDLSEFPDDVVVQADPLVPVRVSLPDPTVSQTLLAYGRAVPPFLLVVYALYLVRGLARSMRNDDPFTTANVRRLRTLSLTALIGAPIVSVVGEIMRHALNAQIPGVPFESRSLFSAGFSAEAAVAGLGIWVLAEVFAHGVRLREDVEATI